MSDAVIISNRLLAEMAGDLKKSRVEVVWENLPRWDEANTCYTVSDNLILTVFQRNTDGNVKVIRVRGPYFDYKAEPNYDFILEHLVERLPPYARRLYMAELIPKYWAEVEVRKACVASGKLLTIAPGQELSSRANVP